MVWAVRMGCSGEREPEGEGLKRNVRRVTRFMASRVSVVGSKITYGVSC